MEKGLTDSRERLLPNYTVISYPLGINKPFIASTADGKYGVITK